MPTVVNKRNKRVRIWYRYPSEPIPRTTHAVVTHKWSISNAVCCSIAKDVIEAGGDECIWKTVLESTSPTKSLLDVLSTAKDDPRKDHVLYALRYASIQPTANPLVLIPLKGIENNKREGGEGMGGDKKRQKR